MKYIELISKSKYGKLNIRHSILQNWDMILSFEKGIFKIYSRDYLIDRSIKKVVSIPSFDLKQYEWLKLPLNCYEAIEHIYNLEWITMNTGRLKIYIMYWLLLFITHIIIYALGIYVWIRLDDESVAMIDDFIYMNIE